MINRQQTAKDAFVILAILMIIIFPIQAREDQGVTPDHGSEYFGFYKYFMKINTSSVTTAELKVYLPEELNWNDDLVLTKEIPLQRDKDQIECQLNEIDHNKIIDRYYDLKKNSPDKDKPDYLTLTGFWRYEFIIDGHSHGKQNGPEIILIWVNPEWVSSRKAFKYSVCVSEVPIWIRLRLNLDKKNISSDFQNVSKYQCKMNFPINDWTEIYLTPKTVPRDSNTDYLFELSAER